jgi:hypothetical protein
MQANLRDARQPARVVYHINSDDVLTYVDDGWKADAVAGHAPALAHGAVGTPLFAHLTGEAVRTVYRRLLEKVRTGKRISFTFRCDAPSLRRLLEMYIRPLGGGNVAFETRTVFEMPRDRIPLLDPDVKRTAAAVSLCPWCERIKIEDWIELEDAVRTGFVPASGEQPTITYALCPDDDHRFRLLLE